MGLYFVQLDEHVFCLMIFTPVEMKKILEGYELYEILLAAIVGRRRKYFSFQIV